MAESVAAARGFRWRSLLMFLSVVGPGIITANADNDVGGVLTYSQAGAQFGYSLLWLLIPVTVALIVTQEMCARMGVVTGKGLADLIRENFGVRITFWVLLIFVICDLGNTATEFAGIAAVADSGPRIPCRRLNQVSTISSTPSRPTPASPPIASP